jgi:DNA-binding GntR family transcriptional regulator
VSDRTLIGVKGGEGGTVNKPQFPSVRNQNLRHTVLEPIRNAILFGQLPVGERLMEAEIAEQMGVSRGPVREALQQLEREGLVLSYAHRGTVVTAVDEDEVDVLYHLRAELEGFAVQSLMRREAPPPIAALQTLVDAMRAAAQSEQLTDLAEKDLEFHRLIVDSSGHRILAAVWSGMDGPIRARLYRSLTGPFAGELLGYTAESHQPIVDAMALGESDRAVTAMKQHILETRRLIEKGTQP